MKFFKSIFEICKRNDHDMQTYICINYINTYKYVNMIQFRSYTLHSIVIQVLNFFKERIEKQYPIVDTVPDEFEDFKYNHDAFMTSRSEMVFGRKEILEEVW